MTAEPLVVSVMHGEIVDRLIAAMCPQRVCVTCGEPSRRITETMHNGTTTRRPTSKASQSVGSGISQGHHAFPEVNPITEHVTIGWTDCGHDNWRPGRVLIIGEVVP